MTVFLIQVLVVAVNFFDISFHALRIRNIYNFVLQHAEILLYNYNDKKLQVYFFKDFQTTNHTQQFLSTIYIG